MTYDFHGGFEPQGPTNFHARLYGSPDDPSPPPADVYNGDHAVQAYLDVGVLARKLSLGIPFYGRGWTGVPDVNDGLYQTATGPAPGTFEPGVMTYEVLKGAGVSGVPRSLHARPPDIQRERILELRRSRRHRHQNGLHKGERARRRHGLGAGRRHTQRGADHGSVRRATVTRYPAPQSSNMLTQWIRKRFVRTKP